MSAASRKKLGISSVASCWNGSGAWQRLRREALKEDDPYAILKRCRLPDGTCVLERRVRVPEKIRRRRRHFIRVPMVWFERLAGASGQTYRIALYLLYLSWRGKGEPVKLANGMLQIDGVSRNSKWRALDDLEHRGLIAVERRSRRSPLVRLLHL